MKISGCGIYVHPARRKDASIHSKGCPYAKTDAPQRDAQEARDALREILRPGDRVLCILRHVSRSGMQRVISLHANTIDADGRPRLRDISGLVAPACGLRWTDKKLGGSGVVMDGCGSDMGWEAVYSLSRALRPAGFGCVGEGCPSNDHSNGDRDYTPHGTRIEKEDFRESYNVHHWHRDGGYALRHEWI